MIKLIPLSFHSVIKAIIIIIISSEIQNKIVSSEENQHLKAEEVDIVGENIRRNCTFHV